MFLAGKMASGKLQHAIGIFGDRKIVLQAIAELKNTGFSMNKISVITRQPELDDNHPRANNITQSEGAAIGALATARTAGLLTLVAGFGILLIPGFGPALAVESALATLLGSGASAAAGGIIGALRGWFLPEEAAQLYHDQVFQGNYLVTIEGTEADILHAEPILQRWGIQEWRVVDVPQS
ncbi:two-component sensor histidine kinase [Nostoc cycadae WK-1]|uniref:Two-component sensor histidine kinase n=2 Tax=Nostoc cycadae TaxID=246795 RepID=A0A2H6LGE8_9NOSO|nr:two-component sensor histidine kinase [Nostoc cycadae WK-1]